MENNIELFDRYIDQTLSQEEKSAFDSRLESDRKFLDEFRIYLFTLEGMCREEEQNDLEFGMAMKKLSREELLRIIGRSARTKVFRLNAFRERLAWAASIAAIIAVGIFAIFRVERAGNDRLDNVLVAYNYIPAPSRDGTTTINITSMSETELKGYLPELENAYRNASDDDLQTCEDTGMRLAMAYLQLHNRDKAKSILGELSDRFAEDEEFAAQCKRILSQLR